MRLADICALLDGWYPPEGADEWDRVGLVCGDPQDEVRRILLAVDPVLAVVEEALDRDADLLICHHPLYLRGTSSVAATTPKGRALHRLVTHGCALFTAHTNADAPTAGVSEAIALALGLVDVAPLAPATKEPLDKIVVFAPVEAAERVRAALGAAGAGRIGDYDSCSFSTPGQGRFRPTEGAHPAIGEVGRPEVVEEVRIEAVCPRRLRARVLAAVGEAHPYEEPAYDVFELAPADDPTRGAGRIGRLTEPMSLGEFARKVAGVLPDTSHGVRVAGDPAGPVRTVALCGGAGDFLLDRARSSGADVYLTSDLRHHPASELREWGTDAPALVDVAHWAAEWTWLPVLRDRLVTALGQGPGPEAATGGSGRDTVVPVDVHVSTTNTDPWTFHL